MKTLLLAYSSKSKGAKRLAKGLGIKRILRDMGKSSFDTDDEEIVINWGNSSENVPEHCRDINMWVNAPPHVDHSVDKVKTFKTLDSIGVRGLKWTLDRGEAEEWLVNKYSKVVVRFNKRGMRSKDMAYIEQGGIVPQAQLYTNFFFHEAELRIHVAFGNVIEFHDKTAAGFDGSHSGEEYKINDEQRTMLSSIAVKTIKALNLDFGAVDILWDAHEQLYAVLEVNTAPEMMNGTLEAYIRAFKAEFNL